MGTRGGESKTDFPDKPLHCPYCQTDEIDKDYWKQDHVDAEWQHLVRANPTSHEDNPTQITSYSATQKPKPLFGYLLHCSFAVPRN